MTALQIYLLTVVMPIAGGVAIWLIAVIITTAIVRKP